MCCISPDKCENLAEDYPDDLNAESLITEDYFVFFFFLHSAVHTVCLAVQYICLAMNLVQVWLKLCMSATLFLCTVQYICLAVQYMFSNESCSGMA